MHGNDALRLFRKAQACRNDGLWWAGPALMDLPACVNSYAFDDVESHPMLFPRSTSRIAAWIACFAILFAAWAPAVSHALAASGNDDAALWTEICTVDGLTLVKSENSPDHDAAGQNKHAAGMEHCPYCLPQGSMPGLPSSSLKALPLVQADSSHPLLFYQAPRPLFVWVPAQSRAPPISL